MNPKYQKVCTEIDKTEKKISDLQQQLKELRDKDTEVKRKEAIFPCIVRIIPQYIFNRSSPIVVGVDVVEGILRPGTPLCVVQKKTKEVVRNRKTTLEDWIPDSDEDENLNFQDSKKSKKLGQEVEVVETVSYVDIGVVQSIKADDKEVPEARPGKAVSISILPKEGSKPALLGRTFLESDDLISHVSLLDWSDS